jgi:tetratricopeptide (TPR) repeat protein
MPHATTLHVQFITRSRALSNLAYLCDEASDFAAARPLHERAVAAATRLGDPALQCLMLSAWCYSAFYSGDWPLAGTLVERADAVMRATSRNHSAITVLLAQGEINLATGNEEVAARVLGEAMRRTAPSRYGHAFIGSQALLAERDLLAGQPEAARERLAPLHDPPYPHHGAVTYGLSLLAWAYRDLGELDRAEALARHAVTLACRRGHRMALVEALRVSALIAVRQGRLAEASATLDEALTCAAPFPYAEAKTLYVFGQLHEAAGDRERARAAYEQALVICARLGERLYAEHIERALAGL